MNLQHDCGNPHFRSGEERGACIRSVGQYDPHASSQECRFLSFDVTYHQIRRPAAVSSEVMQIHDICVQVVLLCSLIEDYEKYTTQFMLRTLFVLFMKRMNKLKIDKYRLRPEQSNVIKSTPSKIQTITATFEGNSRKMTDIKNILNFFVWKENTADGYEYFIYLKYLDRSKE